MTDKGVLILGCGFTGAVLAQRLAFDGRSVYGTTRSEQQALVIRSRGAEPVLLDVRQDLAPLDRLRGRIGKVVCCIPPDMERDGTYVDSTRALLDRFSGWNLQAFVYVSSTSVYGDKGGDVVTEASECAPDSPRGAARLAIEQEVLTSGLRALVVRPAGIYGRGRSQLHRMASGRYRLVAGGEAFTNRIHVIDLAAILDAALTRGVPGTVYLGTDARPATQREVAEHAVTAFGMPQPSTMELQEARVRLSRDVLAMITGSKRLDGSWTRQELGVELRYPSYVEGMESIWRFEAPQLRAIAAGGAQDGDGAESGDGDRRGDGVSEGAAA